MLVCKSWNSAILESSQMWSFCAFHHKMPKNGFPKWLLKTGSNPLRAFIFMEMYSAKSMWPRWISPAHDRITEITLDTRGDRYGYGKSEGFPFAQLSQIPNLTSLDLRQCVPSSDDNGDVDFKSLRSLRVQACELRHTLYMPQLRSIRMVDSTVYVATFLQTVASAKKLEEVDLDKVNFDQPQTAPSNSKLKLNQLKCFRCRYKKIYGHGKYSSESQFGLVRMVHASPLQHLTVTITDCTRAFEVNKVPSSVLSHLRTLNIHLECAAHHTEDGFARCITQVCTWLIEASKLEELALLVMPRKDDPDLTIDVLLDSLLVISKSSHRRVCAGLQKLVIKNGRLVFPQILHKLFILRNSGLPEQERLILDFESHVHVDRNKWALWKNDSGSWKSVDSVDFTAFTKRFSLSNGYGDMDSFFNIDDKEKRYNLLQQLVACELDH